ncbi:MAG: DoxX family protein [Caulobacteraceae bacterium]
MSVDASKAANPRAMTIAGWVFSGLFTAFMLMDIGMKLSGAPQVTEYSATIGIPAWNIPIITVIEGACLVFYLLPPTRILGAVLFTGVFGGTAATHLQVGSPLFTHILFGIYLGIAAWLGLWLRDPKVRAILPLVR